jgi:hypothetical protein
MAVAVLALGAAAAAFLMAPVTQTTVNKTTGTVTYVQTTEYSILLGIITAAVLSVSK